MQKSSQEEARRKHRLSLHRRSRFHTQVPIQENSDDVTQSNSAYMQEDQISGVSRSAYSMEQKNAKLPVPSFQHNPAMHNITYCRSYSTATYQPIYPMQINSTLHYTPLQQGVCPSVSQRLKSIKVRNAIDFLPTSDADDDDVFAPSGSRNLPPHPGFGLRLPSAIPCSSTALQLMQSRKRAHSAGDMIGLYSPNVARFLYPTSNPVPNFKISNNDSAFVNNIPSGATLPQKWIITEQAASSKFDHNHQPQSLGFSNMITTHTLKNSGLPVPMASQPSDTNTSHVKHPAVPQVLCTSENGNKLRKFTKKFPFPQSVRNDKADVSSQTSSVLKSSLSSKSVSTKKKVNWNDLPQQKPKKIADGISHSLKDINVEMIKDKPSEFIEENIIGPFLIGPKLGNCPVKSISQYLVRKSGSSKYYMAKVLQMNEEEVTSGKMLLHTEHSLLSLLSSHLGVIREHGLFKDCCFDAKTGKIIPRVGLILDCLTPHEYDSQSYNFLNLQQYVIQMKRLNELDAIRIFHSILTIVYSLHKSNVVHRDLKLGNMVLDKRTRKIILTNFCLGCHLTGDHDLLTDQRGSPAYISPDVLSDKPYAGKPSDMWSLGVIFYTMLYGQFPFYDQEPKKLFAKIKAADYSIPVSGQISEDTSYVIRRLLTLDPSARLTALGALKEIERNAVNWINMNFPSSQLQVVPDIEAENEANSQAMNQPDSMVEHKNMKRLRVLMLSDDDDSGTSIGVFSKNARKRRIYESLAKSRLNSIRTNQIESVS